MTIINNTEWTRVRANCSSLSLDTCELSRRIGFARAQIEEAMAHIPDMEDNGALYWAYKALVRARDMLATGAV